MDGGVQCRRISGHPHPGHAGAVSENSFPHSGHLINTKSPPFQQIITNIIQDVNREREVLSLSYTNFCSFRCVRLLFSTISYYKHPTINGITENVSAVKVEKL